MYFALYFINTSVNHHCDKTNVGDQNGSSDRDQKEVAPKKKKEGIGDTSKHISDKNNESNTEYEKSSNKDTSSKTKLRRGKKHLRVKPGENQELEKVPTKITEDYAAKKIVPTKITEDNAAKKIVEKQKNYTLDEDCSENDTINCNGSDHNDGAKAKDDTHISATHAVQTDITSDVFHAWDLKT